MVKAAETLSIQQARKLVLHSQQILPTKQNGKAIEATLSAIEHLGYIQIDTLSVVQRAHHHTLWNRNNRYTTDQLNNLLAEKKIFEYWSHAAAYLPMRDFRYSLPRKHAIASEKENHWYERDKTLMKSVLKRISKEGSLMAKDFEHKGDKNKDWGSKPSKRALEYLFMQGELMIPYRKNFHKVYDLTERVLTDGIDTSVPTKEEYVRYLITRYLLANGIGLASEISYLLKNIKPFVVSTLQEMLLAGELIQINVAGETYFALPNSLELLNKPLARSKLKILSPFDNLLIQRNRIQKLFGFNYQVECYVPEAKRKYGYFALPILWNGKLVARMDCKSDRKKYILNINNLVLETSLVKTEAFAYALNKELKTFMVFNNCKDFQMHKTVPAAFKSEFQKIK